MQWTVKIPPGNEDVVKMFILDHGGMIRDGKHSCTCNLSRQISVGGLGLNGKSLFYLYLQETCEEDIQESQTTPSIPPPLLAEKITSWLAENGVSQMVFAKLHME